MDWFAIAVWLALIVGCTLFWVGVGWPILVMVFDYWAGVAS